MLDGALDLSEFQPSTCVIFNRPQVNGFRICVTGAGTGQHHCSADAQSRLSDLPKYMLQWQLSLECASHLVCNCTVAFVLL